MIYSVTFNPSIDYIIQVDDFEVGALNRSKNDYINIGGKGIMVSKLLKNIQIENTALGFIGGFTGEKIKSFFKENSMLENFTKISSDTRINVKLKSSVETEINGRGPEIKPEESEEFLKIFDKINQNDTVIISGSMPPNLSDSFLYKVIEKIRKKGADFVIDTSGQRLIEAIKQGPLVIKPNLEEFKEIFKKQTYKDKREIVRDAKKCIEMGSKYVIVSLGSKGAIFVSKEEACFAPAVKGRLINSVGAGDSMLAGFVGSIKSKKTDLYSFKYSVACGTATAFNEDIASKEEIDEIFKLVKIEEIK